MASRAQHRFVSATRAFFLCLSCPGKGRCGIGVYYGISQYSLFLKRDHPWEPRMRRSASSRPSHVVHDTPSVGQLQALFPNLKAFLKNFLSKRRYSPIRRITPTQSHAPPAGKPPARKPAWPERLDERTPPRGAPPCPLLLGEGGPQAGCGGDP